MMVFEMAHKPADRGREHVVERKLRMGYAHSNDSFPFPLRHKSAPSGSAFLRAWEYEYVDERADVNDYFAESVGTCTVSARRYGDKIIAMVKPTEISART
jgi:hypothetical protein